MYRNLEAELKRKSITRAELAKALKMHISTLSDKLTKENRLKLCEAVEIKQMFFKDMPLEYLFETNNRKELTK